MNEVQVAQAALVFLDRATFQGSESDALTAVKAWLRSKVRPHVVEDAPETEQKPAENA